MLNRFKVQKNINKFPLLKFLFYLSIRMCISKKNDKKVIKPELYNIIIITLLSTIMIIFILCVALVGASKDENYTLVDFSMASASKSDITFELFSSGIEVGFVDETSVKQAIFDRNLKTKFFVHGWLNSSRKSPYYEELRRFYEKEEAHNIIYVDWSNVSHKKYPVATASLKILGKAFANFTIAAGFDSEKIHVIGFSLGAHLSGFSGKEYFSKAGRKVARITALDPAGPKFINADPENRLHRDDAFMVDVVHTDNGHFGYTYPLGRVDFFANGGSHQPGCPSLEEDDNCSHARAVYYFLESLSQSVKAYSAKSWEDFLEGNYKLYDSAIFGENLDLNSTGIFYMETNNSPPYLITL